MNIIERYFPTSTSFRHRLTLRVILIVTIIFGCVGYVINIFIKKALLIEAERGAVGALHMTNQSIENILNSVEVAIENNIPIIENNLDDPGKMYEVVRRIVRVNPMISGSAIAFIPDYFSDEGSLFSPYAFQDSMGIHTKQLGSKDYNYLNQNWFKKIQEKKQESWSEPYYDEGGGNMVMTTYSHPILDNDSNLIAVVTADLSLDKLSMLIDNIKYYDDAYSFAITHDGTYIVHPDTTRLFTKKIFDFANKSKDAKFNSVVNDMISGKSGTQKLYYNHEECYVFFSPVERMKWSIGIVCPEHSFMAIALASSIIIIILLLIGLLLIMFLCSIQVKSLLYPLERFTESTEEIAKGNLNAPLPQINSRDEMFKLHNSFKFMQQSLSDYIQKLETVNEEKGRIKGELNVATNIQRAMIPKVYPPYPERDDVDIFGQLTPAREVGGDLFDFFIRDEKLFFCIGDVSGKGVPASLVMAVTSSLFHTIATHESQPQRIVSQINDFMAENNETSMFVTLFIGVLDIPSGRFRYCNAGHCAPMLLGKEATLLKVKANIPVGILRAYKYQLEETKIPYNTTIFLYTDGLTEAEDPNQKLFGEERMIQVGQAFCQGNEVSPMSLIKKMSEEINHFVKDAEQSDDLSMLALRYCKVDYPDTFSKTLDLPNDISTIPQLNVFVDEVCEKMGFDMATTMSMNLAMEEAVVNVMSYAYPQGMVGSVYIQAKANVKRLKFIITDNGTPFDPTQKEDADVTLSVEERPIGGLGIYLVRQIMDSVNYERIDGKNVLTLRKFLNTPNNES